MRPLLACVILAAAALFAGCIDYDEQITLKKDGSGRIEMRMAMDKESYRMMNEMAADMEEEGGPWSALSEEEIEGALKERKSKAKLVHYSESEEGSDKVWEMTFSFDSFADLTDIGMALDEENDPADTPFTFAEQEDGTWLFKRTLDVEEQQGAAPGAAGGTETPPGMPPGMPENMGEMDPEKLAEQMEKMAESMQKMAEQMQEQQARMEKDAGTRKIRFQATFPGEIVETNATNVDGKTAVWEYPLEKLFQMEGKVPALTARVRL